MHESLYALVGICGLIATAVLLKHKNLYGLPPEEAAKKRWLKMVVGICVAVVVVSLLVKLWQVFAG